MTETLARMLVGTQALLLIGTILLLRAHMKYMNKELNTLKAAWIKLTEEWEEIIAHKKTGRIH